MKFSEKGLTTELDWGDLILPDFTMKRIMEISNWVTSTVKVINPWSSERETNRSFRALFYGPRGTGKTLTASLLGKRADCAVYRFDVSSLNSKFIGETEKKLADIFSISESEKCILFFDEIDALIGKRTTKGRSHDQYANQGFSYLLQRIEDYNGIVIISSKVKANIDEAFLRRFHSIVHFPIPGIEERYRLWRKIFNCKLNIDAIDFQQLAREYEITGGAIYNVFAYSSLKCIEQGGGKLTMEIIVDSIQKEIEKDVRFK